MTSEEAKQAADRLRGVSKYLAQESEFLGGKAVERGIQRTPVQAMRAAHLLDEVVLSLDKHAARAAVEEADLRRGREQEARHAQALREQLEQGGSNPYPTPWRHDA